MVVPHPEVTYRRITGEQWSVRNDTGSSPSLQGSQNGSSPDRVIDESEVNNITGTGITGRDHQHGSIGICIGTVRMAGGSP